MVINYRQIWKANKKPEIKLIKKQIKFTSSHWSTYTKLCQLLKTGQIDKAIKHVENWNHKGTAEIAGQLLEKIINAVEAQKVTITEHSQTIPTNIKVTTGARPALPVGNVQNPRRQEHNDRIQKLLDQEEQRRKDQAAIDKAMKRAAQVEREVREQTAKQQAAEEVKEKKPFKIIAEDETKELTPLEDIGEKVQKQFDKESIPKETWGNVFNDLMKKWFIEKQNSEIGKEIQGYYNLSRDSSLLYEKDLEKLRARAHRDSNISTELKSDLQTCLQILEQKWIERGEPEPDVDPYAHLKGTERWNKKLWDIQSKTGNPDSKTISNLRGTIHTQVWGLDYRDNIKQQIQSESVREKVAAVMDEKIVADGLIDSFASAKYWQHQIQDRCFIEDFGYTDSVGNSGPHISAPTWVHETWAKLKAYWSKQSHAHWSSIAQNIRNELDGMGHRRVPFDSVPYGTCRLIISSKQSYMGIVSTEYEPDKEKLIKIIAWRREQIRKYRDGEITREQINWRMPE